MPEPRRYHPRRDAVLHRITECRLSKLNYLLARDRPVACHRPGQGRQGKPGSTRGPARAAGSLAARSTHNDVQDHHCVGHRRLWRRGHCLAEKVARPRRCMPDAPLAGHRAAHELRSRRHQSAAVRHRARSRLGLGPGRAGDRAGIGGRGPRTRRHDRRKHKRQRRIACPRTVRPIRHRAASSCRAASRDPGHVERRPYCGVRIGVRVAAVWLPSRRGITFTAEETAISRCLSARRR
jgi:hypothetical protein